MAGGEGERERAKKEEGGDGNKAQGEQVETQHRAGEQGGSRAAPGGEGRDFPAGTSLPGPWSPAQSLTKAEGGPWRPSSAHGVRDVQALGEMESKGAKEGRREMCVSGNWSRWLRDSSGGRVQGPQVTERRRPEERHQESRASSGNVEAERVVPKRDALPEPQPAGRAPAGSSRQLYLLLLFVVALAASAM